MLNFKLFFESDNQNEWRRLNDHITAYYDQSGPFTNPKYHENLIRLLQNVGLNDLANELQMIRPSQDDIDFANKPAHPLSLNVQNALNFTADNEKRDSFKAAYKAYSSMIQRIESIIDNKAKEMRWNFD